MDLMSQKPFQPYQIHEIWKSNQKHLYCFDFKRCCFALHHVSLVITKFSVVSPICVKHRSQRKQQRQEQCGAALRYQREWTNEVCNIFYCRQHTNFQ